MNATADAWQKHIERAAKAFLRTAVVIDDEINWSYSSNRISPSTVELPVDDGMGQESTPRSSQHTEEKSDENPDITDSKSLALDLKALCKAFAEQGIVCGPIAVESGEQDKIIQSSYKLSKHADIIILDWLLASDDPTIALSIIEKLLGDAETATRTICIYTREEISLIEGKLREKFQTGNGDILINKNLIKPISKKDTPAEKLPEQLIRDFTLHIDGLLPSFGAAAIAGIRQNAHHVLSTFSKELDGAYVANRLISNPPEDVGEMMLSVLLAEFETMVNMQNTINEYLSCSAIELWLQKEDRIKDKNQNYSQYDKIDSEFMRNFCNNPDFDKFSEDKHVRVSIVLHGEEKSFEIEAKFARLIANRREFYDRHARQDNITLTFGSVIREKSEGKKYYLCVTPACDLIRLTGDTKASFLQITSSGELSKKTLTGEEVSIMLKTNGKNTECFSVNASYKRLTWLEFPVTGGEIRTGSNKSNIFTCCEGVEYEWIAELRRPRTQRFLHGLMTNWTRIGISDSQWLHLASEKKLIKKKKQGTA
ncbi:MAG: hypothetical protein HQL91_02985 [Magnetococcales bacterium]|nr:hypothetical protein [Magnetococcales bacterium]